MRRLQLHLLEDHFDRLSGRSPLQLRRDVVEHRIRSESPHEVRSTIEDVVSEWRPCLVLCIRKQRHCGIAVRDAILRPRCTRFAKRDRVEGCAGTKHDQQAH